MEHIGAELDHDIHVQLEGYTWFTVPAKIRRFSQLENFPKEFDNADKMAHFVH